jgi:hypothetical protein
MSLLLNFLCNCFINNVHVLKGIVSRRNYIILFHLATFTWGLCQLSRNCYQDSEIIMYGVCTLVYECMCACVRASCVGVLNCYIIQQFYVKDALRFFLFCGFW